MFVRALTWIVHLVFPVFLSRNLLLREPFVPPLIYRSLVQRTFRMFLQDFGSYPCCILKFLVTGIISPTRLFVRYFYFHFVFLIALRQHSSVLFSCFFFQLENICVQNDAQVDNQVTITLCCFQNSIRSCRILIPLPCKISKNSRLT